MAEKKQSSPVTEDKPSDSAYKTIDGIQLPMFDYAEPTLEIEQIPLMKSPRTVLWPPTGEVIDHDEMAPVLCKPKLIPLKTVTLERLEQMQTENLEKLRQETMASTSAQVFI